MAEWNFAPQWAANVGFRLYQDSGEIESSGLNASAPGLDGSEISAGLRWDRGDLSISGTVGLLTSDYQPLSADNLFFGNLYRDRDWWTLRLSASFSF